jgi:hypothetical protein
MRVITYVIRDDYAEEYPHIDKDTTIQGMLRFDKVITLVFGLEYL